TVIVDGSRSRPWLLLVHIGRRRQCGSIAEVVRQLRVHVEKCHLGFLEVIVPQLVRQVGVPIGLFVLGERDGPPALGKTFAQLYARLVGIPRSVAKVGTQYGVRGRKLGHQVDGSSHGTGTVYGGSGTPHHLYALDAVSGYTVPFGYAA